MMTRFAAVLTLMALPGLGAENFRPPSVPLVTYNPFLSVWSHADHLNDINTKHWTRHDHALVSLIRIDGKTYRLMGQDPVDVPALRNTSVRVLPTRSIYEFDGAGVLVTMTFLEPALPQDLDVYSWPLSYIVWNVRSRTAHQHRIQVYFSASSQLSVNRTSEPVVWSRKNAGELTLLRAGTESQPVLASSGDDHRIDWGYVYTAASTAESKSAIGFNRSLEGMFAEKGSLGGEIDTRMPRAAYDNEPVLAFSFDLGSLAQEAIERRVVVAYDELFAIKYFGRKLVPYWARKGATMADLLQTAAREYPVLVESCRKFDEELMADMTRVGGEQYARIAALAYRECVAANGLAADANQQPLLFTKENTSNGDIATVDVIFPMDPIWILLSPSLARASLVAVLDYSASPRWKFPNAPHDLGRYPLVTGRDDGGEGMPVEESGNMLILCDAIAHAEGNADFVKPWWPQLTQWAQYLEQYGLDPENQLCTDDFMGHLAHNANLSVKAILALAAYGDLCRMRGDQQTAGKYFELAKADAAHWIKVADDGDHYRLAFDKPGTWSQKYNLVWDSILGLHVFPPSVASKELAYYKRVMNRYGVPLDSRTALTKTDWLMWSASMAGSEREFASFIAPIYGYLDETPIRNPVDDSYDTVKASKGGNHMHARPVVGGFFIRMLTDPDTWHKWASRDTLKPENWAPIPQAPRISPVIPAGQTWRYTTSQPASDWMQPAYDASAWQEGQAGFGSRGAPGLNQKTLWRTPDIWLRREFVLPAEPHPNLQFLVFHDEDVEIYVDGVKAAQDGGFTRSYIPLEILPAARAMMNPGAKVTIAIHCHQTTGGQGIDVGFADVTN